MKIKILLVISLLLFFLGANTQTVTIDIQESGGGCTLGTDCQTNTACFDLIIYVDQSNWQLASYNIWTEYPAPPVMSYYSDNACLTQNGGDTDNNTNGTYRVAGINGLTVIPVNIPTIFHTICYTYSDENDIVDSIISSGGTKVLYSFDFFSTITLVKANTGQTVAITITNEDFLNLNSGTFSCLISDLVVNKELTSNADNDNSGTVSLGDVLTYTVTATNTGVINQHNVTINDPMITPSSAFCATLLQNESCVLTGTYVVTQADVDAGEIQNSATVDSDEESPITEEHLLPVPQEFGLTADKTLLTNISGGVLLGDILTYSIVVTNTGNTTLHNVTVNDPKITPPSASCPVLAPGSTCTLTGIHVVTQADLNAGQIVNTATADSDETGPVTDQVTTPLPQYPQLNTQKTLLTDISGGVAAGDVLFYSVSAVNTGNVTLHNVVVQDSKITPSVKNCPSLAPFSSCTLTGFYIVKQSDINAGQIVNTGTGDSDETPPDPDQLITILPQSPQITLVKTLLTDVSTGIHVGDILAYTVVATNIGNISLNNVTISDPMLTPAIKTCAVVTPLGSCTLAGTYVVKQSDVDAGQIINNASVTSDETAPVNTQLITPIVQVFDLSTSKTLLTDISGGVNAGDILDYSVVVTNTGNVSLHNVTVSDVLLTPSLSTCPILTPGQSCTLTGSYILTQNDINNGELVNTGIGDSDETTPEPDQVITPLAQVAQLQVLKSAQENYYFLAGDIIHYDFIIENTGNVTIDNISLSDPQTDPGSIACNRTSLNPGETITCEAIRTVKSTDITNGIIENIATAQGEDPDGNSVMDQSNAVILPYGGPLPDVFAGADDFFCENGFYVLSNATVQNASSVLWQTSGDGTFNNNISLNATYYPGSGDIAAGTVALTINAYPIPPAVYIDTDIIVLTLMPLPVSDAGFDLTVCENQISVVLSGTALHGCGVLWTTNGNGVFDNDQITNAQYTFGTSELSVGSVQLCMEVIPCSPCVVSDNDCITITFDPLPEANAGSNVSICENQTAQLNGSAQNYSSVLWGYASPGEADGTFNNPAILNPVYTPGSGDIASGYANLVFTAQGVNPCTVSASDYLQIAVISLPEVFAGADGAVCENGTYALTGATASNFGSLFWTGNVNNPTILNPVYTPTPADILAGSAMLCLTAQPIGPCLVSSSDCITITIQHSPNSFAGNDATICQGEDFYLSEAFAENAGGIQWVPVSGAGTFSNELIQNPVYYPNPSIDYVLGCVTLQIVVAPVSPCSVLSTDQMVLCFDTPATVDAGSDATICEDDVFTANPVIANGGVVNWISSGNGTFDNPSLTNATYTPGTNDAGNYVILTINVNSTGACTSVASDDVTLFIAPAPVAYAGNDAIICEMVNLPPVSYGMYSLSEAWVSNSCGQSWSTSGDGDFDNSSEVNPVYTLGSNDISTGSVELCLTAHPCSPCLVFASDCLTLSVQHLPAADAGSNITICGNEQALLNGSAWNYSGVYWDYAVFGQGDGVFSNQTILNPSYTPGTDDIAIGFVNLVLVALPQSPCLISDSDVVHVTIYKQPDVFAGFDASICQGQSYQLSAATAGDYSSLLWTGGTGSFVPSASILNPLYSPGAGETGNLTLCLTAQPLSPCTVASTDCLLLTIQALPLVNAGSDFTLVFDQDYTTSPVINGSYASVSWSHNGTGSFDNPSLLNATYTPGAGDEGNVVTLTLSVIPGGACATPVLGNLQLTFEPSPINAINDTGTPVSGASGGTVVTNVLSNDELNGLPVDLADVILTQVSTTSPNVILDPLTGEIIVLPGTPAGTYYVVYQICEIAFPSNCDQATVTVEVTAAPIEAINDTGIPVNGMTGGEALANVLVNDLLDGSLLDPADVTLSFISSTNPGITLNILTGSVNVAPGTPAGTYYLVYEICEVINPTNCDQATVTVEVTAPPILANDDTGSPVSGINGGEALANVLVNDQLNGLPVDIGDILLTEVSSTNPGVTLDPLTGAVIVTPGTPEGTYYLVYEICEVLNPANCDQATVTVIVTPATIVANDDLGIPVNGLDGGVAVINVLVNDMLNGFPVDPADITLTEVSSTNPGVSLNPVTGEVNVAPGTPAGTYYLVYQICENINPANCEQATVTVIVTAAPIVANDDTGIPVNGMTGGQSFANVLTNDELNNLPVDPLDIYLTQISTTNPGVTLDPLTGAVNVAPGTSAGTYSVVYEICEILNPANCDPATVLVEVTAAPIIANNDTGLPVNGYSGGQSVSNVLVNDLLNNLPVDPADILLLQISTTNPGVTLDPLTGAVNVTPGTPAGIYELVYEICEVLNPSNCDQATVTVEVTAAPIVAVDDAGVPVNGNTGGQSVGNVLDNDLLNGLPVNPGDVTLTQISTTNPGITLDPVTGAVNVGPGIPAGTYELVYEICEVLNPTNCDQATVTIIVTAAPIVAVDDTGTPVNGMSGGVPVPNVLVNDLLDGILVDPADVILSFVSSTNPGITLDPLTGAVIVASGTPAGTYYLVYEICEVLNPTNCDEATVTVEVTAAPILANNDTGTPVSGINGGEALANVLINDLLNGLPVDPADVTLTEISSTSPGISLDPLTGAVNVAPGTPEGTYYLVYEICEVLNPSNCDQATVTVIVTPATIVANDDTGIPVNGLDGGVAVVNVLVNDMLNGFPVDPADVALTEVNSTNPGVSLDPVTGEVNVAPGTPAGTYYLVYEICENINPTNCEQATVTVIVTAAPIVANDDTGVPVNGMAGGQSFANVLTNDELNNLPVDPLDIYLTQISTTNPGVTLDPLTGAVDVAPGTPAGNYELVYEICEVLNPSNCDQATVFVPVSAALIDAVDDTGTAVNGMTGGQSLTNVLVNDELNNLPVDIADIFLSQVSTTHPGVTLDPLTGAVNVAPGTPAGIYELVYEICEVLNPSNCDQATVTVEVTAAPIDANDDTGLSVNGYSGGQSLANVLTNDLLNNLPVVAADVILGFISSTNPGITLDLLTGSVNVAPGTPAGTYYLVYEICEVLNPTNCDQATVTVTVIEPPALEFCFNGLPAVQGSSFDYCDNDVISITVCDIITGVAPFDICFEINGTPDCVTAINLTEAIFNSTLAPGNYTVNITSIVDANNLSAVNLSQYQFEITVVAQPFSYAGINGLICAGQQYALFDAVAENYSSFEWAGGDGSFSPDIYQMNPVYTPGLGDIANGNVELCLLVEPNTPCSMPETDCMILTIQGTPVVNTGGNATVCETDQFTTNATASNYSSLWWSTSGNGFFYEETELITIYQPGSIDLATGFVELCLSATADACFITEFDCMVLYFDRVATAFAGNHTLICSGETYTINDAVASNYSTLLWSTNGDGQFLPSANVLNPEYVPGVNDQTSGSVELCLTANATGECTLPAIECLNLTIVPIPVVDLPAETELGCSDFDRNNNEWLPIPVCATISNAYSVAWTTSGDGTFIDPSDPCTDYIIGYHDAWDGEVTLTITVSGGGSCSYFGSDETILYIPIQLIYFEKNSWQGMSSYVDKTNTSVPDVMYPIVGSIPGSTNLIIMNDKDGNYYWPEGTPPTNNLGNLQPTGYKAKLKNTPCCLPIYGDTLTTQTFTVTGTFTYVPVLTNIPVDINALFLGHYSKIYLIWDFGQKLWLGPEPVAGKLETLYPGRSYMLVAKNKPAPYTLTYPTYDQSKPIQYNEEDGKDFVNTTPWNDVVNTTQAHFILFADEVTKLLEEGDVFGTFNENGVCVGMEEFADRDGFMKLIAMGDDSSTDITDGFLTGENMDFRLYRQETGETFDVSFIYDETYPSSDGMFTPNGVSRVIGLSMNITTVGDLEAGTRIDVFPNPATEVVNIRSTIEMTTVSLIDNVGKIIMVKTINAGSYSVNVEHLPSGIYFVQIVTVTGEKVTRMISVN